MAVTRKSLATEFERQDAIIEAANRAKRDAMNRYRGELDGKGWGKDAIKAESENFRKAFARKRAIAKYGLDAVEEADAQVEEILAEIDGPRVRVTRGAREAIDHDPETGEIIEPDSIDATALFDADGNLNPEPANSSPGGPGEPAADSVTVPQGGDAPIQPETAHEAYSAAPEAQSARGLPVEDSGSRTGGRNEGVGSDGAGAPAERSPNLGQLKSETPRGEPVLADATSGAGPGTEPGLANEGEGGAASAVPSNVTAMPRQPKYTDPPHPDCLNPAPPHGCGGLSNLGLCQRCKEAAQLSQVA